MIEDEDRRATRPGRVRFEPAVMDGWDVEDLRSYISALQAEIARAEAAIASRERQRSAADALFRRP